jgi:hypothetical protein
MRKVEGKGTTRYYSFGIYEVYTKPKGWTEDPIEPHGETLDELRRDYEAMSGAFKLPALDHKTGRKLK